MKVLPPADYDPTLSLGMKIWPELAGELYTAEAIRNLIGIRLFKNGVDVDDLNHVVDFSRKLNAESGEWPKAVKLRLISKLAYYQSVFDRPADLGVMQLYAQNAIISILSDRFEQWYAGQEWTQDVTVSILVNLPWKQPEIYSGMLTPATGLLEVWKNDYRLEIIRVPVGAKEMGAVAAADAAECIASDYLHNVDAAKGVRLLLGDMLMTNGDGSWAVSSEQIGIWLREITNPASVKPVPF